MCHPPDSDATAYTGVEVLDELPPETAEEYDLVTVSQGRQSVFGPYLWLNNVTLEPDPDPALGCVVITFRTFVAQGVAAATEVCNSASAEYLPMGGARRQTVVSDPACFTVDGDCSVASFTTLDGLKGVKDGRGARFTWEEGRGAPLYHLNSVTAKTELTGTGPHRPPVAGAVAAAECDAALGTPMCLDPDALDAAAPVLFYRVLAACGASGLEEGPP